MSNDTHRLVTRRESADQQLTVLQVRDGDDFEQIHPIGEIDLSTAPALREALSDTERRQVPNVLVDLSDVHFLALVGVQVLRAASSRSTAERRRLVLAAPTRPVQRVLSLTEATGELEVYVTLTGAKSALSHI
jgi:stage II sporulation protein AA (anti-sigma F factor antagonist)